MELKLEDIQSLEDYRKNRDAFRKQVMQIKDDRRIILGPYLNFLFENRETMLYQIQEMIHAESIVSVDAIQHEINTYNQMIPKNHELKATLLLEFSDADTRRVKLKELVGIESKIHLLIDRKHKVSVQYDPSQVDPEKLSSVQFLTFPLGKEIANIFLQTEDVDIMTSHPACSYRATLSEVQLNALKEDVRKQDKIKLHS